jgi:hypothetical protein
MGFLAPSTVINTDRRTYHMELRWVPFCRRLTATVPAFKEGVSVENSRGAAIAGPARLRLIAPLRREAK